jgi:hypothetical protein
MASVTDTYLNDIAFVTDLIRAPSGDLGQVNGPVNVTNALFRRLVTVPGTLVHRPTYGVGIQRWENRMNSLASQREIANAIQEQFLQDPRVQSVYGVLIQNTDTAPEDVTIIVRVQLVGQNDLTTLTFVPFGAA